VLTGKINRRILGGNERLSMLDASRNSLEQAGKAFPAGLYFYFSFYYFSGARPLAGEA
jgi:hypothetical protein